MQFRVFGTRVTIRFSFFLVIILFVLRDVGNLFAPVFAAVIAHELGHILVIRLVGARVSSADLSLTGIHIQTQGVSELSVLREIAIHIAGPATNLLLAGVLFLSDNGTMLCKYAVAVNLLLAMIHMLPVGNLDGGNILRCVTMYLFTPQTASVIAGVISTALLLVLLLILIKYRASFNFTAVLLWVYMFIVSSRAARVW